MENIHKQHLKIAFYFCFFIADIGQSHAAEKYWYDLGGGLLTESAQQACDVMVARRAEISPATLEEVEIIDPPWWSGGGYIGLSCHINVYPFNLNVGVKYESYVLFDPLETTNLSCTVGNPIDPVSGSKLHKEEIVNLSGVNDIFFNYYYDSMVNGGWSHEYNKTVTYSFGEDPKEYNFNDTYILDPDFITQGQTLYDITPSGETARGKLQYGNSGYSTPETACRNWVNFKTSYSYDWISSSTTNYIGNGKCEVLAENQVKFVVDIYSFTQGINSSQVMSNNPLLPARISFKRHNGSLLEFVYDTAASAYLNSTNTGETIEIIDNGLEILEFLLFNNDDSIERYSVDASLQTGQLTSIEYINGNSLYLTYDALNLIKISAITGEYLDLIYESFGENGLSQRIKSIKDKQGRLWSFDYNINNDIEYLHHPDGVYRKYIYGEQENNLNLLTGIEDENGNHYARWDYDSDHRAILSAHGNTGIIDKTTLSYSDESTVNVTVSRESSTTADISNLINEYRTNVISNNPTVSQIKRIACVDCENEKLVSSHDLQTGDLEFVEDKGQRTEYSNYDTKGNPGTITEAAGTADQRETSYTYDSRYHSKISTITETSIYPGNQKTTSYLYDDVGNNTEITVSGFKPDGAAISRTASFEYNGPYHQLTQINGPRTDVSDIHTISYYPDDVNQGNNRARMKSVTAPLNITLYSDITYTPTGKIKTYLAANNVRATLSYYTGNDRLKSLEQHDLDTGKKQLTEWTYLATGEVESVITGYDALDKSTLTFHYDDARRLTNIVDDLGNTIEYILDTEGNVEQENFRDVAGNLKKQLTQTFNVYNRLELRTQVNEQLTETWSPDGTLDKVVDGKNVITDYSYDNLRRLTQINQDMGGASPQTADALTTLNYDVQDNLSSVTDPVNGQTIYIYDDLGNLLTKTSPDTGTTTYTYDGAGNIKSSVDAKGQLINYSYDAMNRILSLDAPGTVNDYSYTYDNCVNGSGLLCTVASTGTAVSFAYDAFGNISNHQNVSYSFDSANRIQTITYPSGAIVTYSYDVAGQVSQLELTRNGSTVPLARTISYAPFGEVENLTYGNGLFFTQDFDQAYRTNSQIVAATYDMLYSQYDANGNLQSRTDNISASIETYSYDYLNRLDTASGMFGLHDYDYDKNANRTQLDDGSITSYSYKANSNRMLLNGVDSVRLDANGNTEMRNTQNLSYTPQNRLYQVYEDASLVVTYGYNGLGQRVSKTLADGTITQYVYNTDGKLLADLDAQGDAQQEYIYLNGKLIVTLVMSTFIPDSNGADIIIDNGDAGTSSTGSWKNAKRKHKHYGTGYMLANGSTGSSYRWTPTLGAGNYEVFAWWRAERKASSSVPYSIVHNGTSNKVNVNQTTNGSQWVSLGVFEFTGAGGEYLEVSDSNGKTLADAVRLVELVDTTPQLITDIYYVHNDHLETPKVLTNETGTTVWSATHDPFGKATVDDDVDGDGKHVEMNVRFPGQYFDRETKLHYNYFRTYDPETGRYITSDPIGLTGGSNTYGYAGGNPVSYIDPYGLDFEGLIRERKRARQMDPRYDLKEFVDSNGLSHNADDLLQRQKDLIKGPAKEATKEGAEAIYIPTLKKLKELLGLDKPEMDPDFSEKEKRCE